MSSEIFYSSRPGNNFGYSVGQGIGFYSSWTSLALTHHVIIRECGRRAGLRGFRDYLVLGDDMVVANGEVASIYKEVMAGLGVDINLTKSIIPGQRRGVEFASMLVLGGVNLSPLPVGLIVKKDLISQIQLLDALVLRFTYAKIRCGHGFTEEDVFRSVFTNPKTYDKKLML